MKRLTIGSLLTAVLGALIAVTFLVSQVADNAEALAGANTVALDFDTNGNTATNIGAGGSGIDAGDIQSDTASLFPAGVPIGGTFTVDLVVDSVPAPGLFGIGGEFNYKKTILKVVGVDTGAVGTLLQFSTPVPALFVGSDILPDTDGSFRVDAVDLGGSDETGEGRVLGVTFECIAVGSSYITLTDGITGGGANFGILNTAAAFPVGTEVEGTALCATLAAACGPGVPGSIFARQEPTVCFSLRPQLELTSTATASRTQT